MSNQKKIILDVDPGHDDAIAILVAAQAEELDLRGITVVAGNQTLPKTLQNTLNLCSFADIEVPVYAGMDRPMVREQVVAPDIHGENGLGGVDLPPAERTEEETHAVNFIIEEALASDGDLILVPTGPLSNIAMALNLAPKIKDKISKIVLMGGSYGSGNRTPEAEFNIFVDPEAAKVVFESGIPIVMTGLDLTHQAKADQAVIEQIDQLNNPVADLTLDLLDFYGAAYQEFFGFATPPVHDVCAVAKVIEPDIFTTQKIRVDIETSGELTAGRTVCDFNGVSGREPNAEVAMELDKEQLWEIVIANLGKY